MATQAHFLRFVFVLVGLKVGFSVRLRSNGRTVGRVGLITGRYDKHSPTSPFVSFDALGAHFIMVLGSFVSDHFFGEISSCLCQGKHSSGHFEQVTTALVILCNGNLPQERRL